MDGGIPSVFQHPATPVFGICGSSDAERARLLGTLDLELAERGLSAVIIRQDPQDEETCEVRVGGGKAAPACDLILVDCLPSTPLPKLLLDGGKPLDLHEGEILRSFPEQGRFQAVLTFLLDRVAEIWRQTPVWACVLIGGKSSRMGRPKHLITDDTGAPWITRTVGLLLPLVDGLVISGAGLVPKSLKDIIRVPDVPGLAGPLAGILSAMRWQPKVTWLLVACDMPDITEEAVNWILARRRPGKWATVPRLRDDDTFEPLFAHYDFRSRHLFEELAGSGCLRIGAITENPKIETPLVPGPLSSSWRNVNTPHDL